MTENPTSQSATSESRHEVIPPAAFWLGWSGVLPFAALSAALFVLDGTNAALAAKALVIYGAVILSFMGGAQWGIAISKRGISSALNLGSLLGISVIPALAGWVAALLPLVPSLMVLASAFLALLGFDLWTVKTRLAPRWYSNLRKQLTAAVIICLSAGAIAA